MGKLWRITHDDGVTREMDNIEAGSHALKRRVGRIPARKRILIYIE
jgi:hypothetical protein